jgi:hypothetical protein
MMRGRLSKESGLVALLLAFLVLAVVYGLVTPPFESPDEVGHFSYIRHLLTTRSLPVQRIGEPGEAHQPPLYYLIAALIASPADLGDQTGVFRPNPEFIWAGRGGNEVNAGLHGSADTFPFRGHSLALRLARVSSILMGVVTVAFTTWIAWRVFPNRPEIGLLAGTLVAFNPQFLFNSSSVNNDSLLTMVTTISWWQLLRAAAHPEQQRQWASMGVLVGMGLLAKINGGLVIGLASGIVLLTCAIRRRSPKLFINGASVMVVVPALLSGWWYARNQLLYGDLLGLRVYQEIFAVNLRSSALQWGDLKDFFSIQFRSFWGVFGWMNVPSPEWLYRFFGVLCLAGLLGLGIRALQHRLRGQSTPEGKATSVALLFTAVAAQEVYMLAIITRCNASCYQGRYLFPAIAPLMIIVSWGLTGLLPRRRRKELVVLMVIAVMLVTALVAVFVPFDVIGPAYETVPIATWRLWLVPRKTSFDFGGMFRLAGYDMHLNEDGMTIVLTLYWQALGPIDFNYSVFVHLIDGSDRIVAQHDHAPGEDRGYSPIGWWPGDIVVDEHRTVVPGPLASGTYRLRIGVYNWATGERLPALADGEQVGDSIVLGCSMER